MYGTDNPKDKEDYGRIVAERHFKSKVEILKKYKKNICLGGDFDAKTRYMQPTILRDIKLSDDIMTQEMFAPILQLVPVKDMDEAIKFVQQQERSLSAYAFTNNKKLALKLKMLVTCGGMCINDTLMHFSVPSFPFGGVGASGMGRYHGKYTFNAFTHEKPVLTQTAGGESMNQKLRYPPHNASQLTWIQRILWAEKMMV